MSNHLINLSRRISERILCLTLSIMMGVYSFWLSSNRTWRLNFGYMPGHFSDTFFQRQAVSILHGRLDVSGGTYANDGECWYRAGKCFGYFGVFPSLVRFPLFLVSGQTTFGFTPVSIGLASGLSLWASLDILRYAFGSSSRQKFNWLDRKLIIVAMALLLGSGGSLVSLSQAKVFREAIAWMIALLLLAFCLVLRWIATNQNRFLLCAVVAATCATNSRPSAIPAVIGLGLWLYARQHKSGSRLIINFTSLQTAMIIIPAATVFVVFYLKFKALTPQWPMYATYDGPTMQRLIRLNNGTLQGIRFTPTNLVQYFRPDSVAYSLGSPWARVLVPNERPPILLPPIVNTGMMFEPTPSITNTMPIQLLLSVGLFVVALAKSGLRRFVDTQVALPLMTCTALVPIGMLVAFGNTGRYAGDFFPFLVVGTVFGGIAFFRWLQQKGHLRPALYLIMLTAAYFTMVQFALNTSGWNFSG